MIDVALTLPVLGTYGRSAPFNCAKTDRIVENAAIEQSKITGLRLGKWLA